MAETPTPNAARNRTFVRGCLTFVIGFWVLLVLVGAVTGLLFWRWSKTPEGSEFVERATQGVRVLRDGMGGPEAEAIQALGCDTAMVLDARQMMDVIDPSFQLREGEDITVVLCQTSVLAPTVSCERIAQAWLDFNGGLAPSGFLVQSQRQGGQAVCQEARLPDGTLSPQQPAGAP